MGAVTPLHRTSQIVVKGSQRFFVNRIGTRFVVSEYCDCILGPHWHHLADVKTRREVDDLIAKIVALAAIVP